MVFDPMMERHHHFVDDETGQRRPLQRRQDVIGAEATVILTIPSHGVGSISYEAAGSRFTSPARSMAGTEIRQDARVIVRERDGQVLVVVPR